jgi:hypothetical protein
VKLLYEITNNYCFFAIAFMIFFQILYAIYSYTTYFEKTITIKEKDSLKNGKHGKNVVADSEGNIYSISNAIAYLFFTSTELYANLEEGKKYKITGFGQRIPLLNMFPSIISATKA